MTLIRVAPRAKSYALCHLTDTTTCDLSEYEDVAEESHFPINIRPAKTAFLSGCCWELPSQQRELANTQPAPPSCMISLHGEKNQRYSRSPSREADPRISSIAFSIANPSCITRNIARTVDKGTRGCGLWVRSSSYDGGQMSGAQSRPSHPAGPLEAGAMNFFWKMRGFLLTELVK